MRKRPEPRDYIFSFDRPEGDIYRRVPRRLQRAGLMVEALPHKTSYRVRREPRKMPWSDFRHLLIDVVDDRRGTFLLTSLTTGNAW